MGLAPDDVVIDRAVYLELRDQLYVMQAALEDAALDLGQGRDPLEVVEELRAAARPLVRLRWDPKAVGS